MENQQNVTSTPTLELAHERLVSGAERVESDPLTNSVFDYALSEFSAILDNPTRLADIEALIDTLHLTLATERAETLREQHFPLGVPPFSTVLESELENLARQGWEKFQDTLQTDWGGFVFTAHPTFALPFETRSALAAHVEEPTSANLDRLTEAAKLDGRAWSQSINLHGEHEETQSVLANAQSAMRAYTATVLETAQRFFPDTWRDLRPAVPSLASWVGYDLDGRTDIDWWQSVALRLSEKSVQLGRYADRLRDIGVLPQLEEKLRRAQKKSLAEANLFQNDLSDLDALLEAASELTKPHPDRIINSSEISEPILVHLPTAPDTIAAALIALLTEIEALQLGTARIHLRVNAAQVRAVMMRDLGLETEDSAMGRLALQRLAEKVRSVQPKSSNFAELFFEKSTAKRQIMMSAIWLQHIDSTSPIRFLIAEAENPATVMGVLYLAKQFGIEDRLDISPLFETPEALETGGRFIERLLEEEEYVDYIRKRGRLSIQLGFSDAGRFIGQLAANMAIERIHNLIANALYNVAPEVSLLIFNTHGESMGRGAYPGSFADRFEHCLSCWTRTNARDRGQHLIHEVSFQGGDGFIHFASEGLALSTYSVWCLHHLTDVNDCSSDPFYQDTDFTWDVYRRLRYWQTLLFSDKDYGFLLNSFATQFLVRAGSRQRRRSGKAEGPRALRAISHNATLQQLGVPVNTVAGFGSALRREIERFVNLLNASERMQNLMKLALSARLKTSLPVLRGYASVYDPATWAAIARHSDHNETGACERTYRALRDGEVANSLKNMASHFAFDLMKFDSILSGLDSAPSTEQRHQDRINLHVLHGLRQAIMMYAFHLAGRLPSLSRRHDASRADFMELIVQMRLDEAQQFLQEVFPASEPELEKLQALTDGTPLARDSGYDQLNEEIIAPLGEVQKLMHKITLALVHAYNAYG